MMRSTDGKGFDHLFDLLPAQDVVIPILKTIIFHDNTDYGCG